jgi:hypothetical protein
MCAIEAMISVADFPPQIRQEITDCAHEFLIRHVVILREA